MSVQFSDNFNSGSLTGWGSPNTLSTLDLWGFNNTYCVACATPSDSSRKTLGSPITNTGSIRAQVAAILTASDPTDGSLQFNIQDFNAGVGSNNFQLLVYLLPSGAFRIRMNHNGVAVFTNTAGSLFPIDGTQFGLQVRFTISATSSVIFTVNNIDVATINESHVYRANQWDDIWIYGTFQGIPGAATVVTTVDNYEVDDSDASISWPAGNAPQLRVDHTCLDGPPSPTITDINIDCSSGNIVIIGTDFPMSPTITLTVNGINMLFTIIFSTSTQIVVHPNSFINGNWCALVQ